jgi:hypothetical protein
MSRNCASVSLSSARRVPSRRQNSSQRDSPATGAGRLLAGSFVCSVSLASPSPLITFLLFESTLGDHDERRTKSMTDSKLSY